ncbi:MAG TPA: SMP-30/gluconolactonase/LRE family protein [Candidatus Acidoferrum sp.]|nr:SMP-30/gluconolactonase/LRE family protein [Candidatus Acidoferrum sp.]
MNLNACVRRLAVVLALLFCATTAVRAQEEKPQPQQEDEVRGAPAEPVDAADVRAQVAAAEALLPTYVDRGAVLYFLAAARMHLGETREALDRLQQCMALDEGFDPSGGSEFAALRSEHAFMEMIDRAKTRFPVVARARKALVTEEKDLVPEGLAWDAKRGVFYLSSLHRRKIVQINLESRVSDFLQPQQQPFFPVLGIRLDPNDGTIWANTWEEKPGTGRSEILHIASDGKVLARFASEGSAPHGFNDLVVRKTGDLFTTDSLANQVFRLDPESKTFSPLHLHRQLYYPNGIALAGDDRSLFIADALGVVKYDIAASSSVDVAPGPHNTLAGVDGLYWYQGSLIAIQNGIGTPRVAAHRLSADGGRVSKATILEFRTTLSVLPTTGAIRGSDFYFIANSQLDNLNGDKILDITRLEPVRIAVVHLP